VKSQIDGSVYPDCDPPQVLQTLEQKADYLHRIVAAFDFGIPPDAATLRLLSTWRDVFDAFPLPASPGYHALRSYFAWPESEQAPFPFEPTYLRQDAWESRVDGCEDRV
jgi:hypothetical protein